ncbi:asparagine synthase (glutamine-hydrolyzing), partial [Desulfosarcina sp.]|uniref:asparagine synthase (glutamine-hydrolyzing) n=1 Tax=Desulfosarcina sp. TaxID=2027861 RepID=UPI00397068BC
PVVGDVHRALDSIGSRGPDGRGTWQDEGALLGHLRLAVIDLSKKAAQPMQTADGRLVIVFNGEIYNFEGIKAKIGSDYPWQSESDTEVILASYLKWGPDCLQKFHGMFAVAIWDRLEKTLFVARDRAGVKPFYYHSGDGVFAFASRPRALFKLLPGLSREFDPQALRYYLEAGYIPAPFSCHREIRKLEPGHYMLIRSNGIQKCHYWSLDAVQIDERLEKADEQDLIDELDQILDRSIRLRMVSSVPVGAFLSGGIDSSLVAYYMQRHAGAPVKTFTIGFDDAAFDESRHARAVAGYLGTEHVCEKLKPDDLLDLMPQYLAEYDEPFFDYSAFPVMAVSRLARKYVKVSLSGDGGDEAFGGYHYYRIVQALGIFQRFPDALRQNMSRLTGKFPDHRLRLLASAMRKAGPVETFAFIRSVIKDFGSVLSEELRSSTRSMASLFKERADQMPTFLTPAELGMRLDIAFTLPDDYLQKVDVGSMAFSLESREPLLDHTIMEWAAKLPLRWKLRGGVNKYLLRKLAYRHVPQAILDRPKMGFGVPMARWLRGELRSWGERLLVDHQAMDELGLHPPAVMRLWRDHQAGSRDAHTILWTILILLQFYRNQS